MNTSSLTWKVQATESELYSVHFFGTVSKNNVPFHSTVRYATVYDVGGAPVKEQESLLQQDV
jgi:hypothetical protein